MTFEPRWDCAGFVAEAVVAALAAEHDPDGCSWEGGRRAKVDVTWKNHRVDVKRCFILDKHGPNGKEPHLGFMGSGPGSRDPRRRHSLRAGVSACRQQRHYRNGRCLTITALPSTVFLVPAGDVARFYRAHLADGSGEGRGRNRYVPVGDAERWRVFGPPLPL